MLLYGPPGSGKTEFVKYIGGILHRKVLVRLGADLLDMYVGGTERQIREAFAEAEETKAILFLDEVDGMLRSRQMARHGWEVTQVNELLHCMESFNGILVCATNHHDSLDPATLRRFVFKLEFDYLDKPGKLLFFQKFLSSHAESLLTSEEEAILEAMPSLTPGDFSVVRERVKLSGMRLPASELLAMLRLESDIKRNGRRQSIGFCGNGSNE